MKAHSDSARIVCLGRPLLVTESETYFILGQNSTHLTEWNVVSALRANHHARLAGEGL